MPNAAALSSEYVPRRHRPFAVTLTIVCIPLGGTLAGVARRADPAAVRLARALSGRRHPAARPGGRPVEGASGVSALSRPAPAALARARRAAAPARPRRAARRGVRRRHGARPSSRASARELLVPEFRRDTLALCASFFFCLLSVYIGVNWVPSLLDRRRLRRRGRELRARRPSTSAASSARFSARSSSAASARASRCWRWRPAPSPARRCWRRCRSATQSAFAVLAMLAWTGGLINAVQTTMYALAAHVYPDGHPRHRRRHGGRLRPHRRRAGALCRIVGARIGRRVAALCR